MKVFSINPNNGEYFEDKECLGLPLYQGAYSYTPIYPLYTFFVTGRFDYNNQNPKIEFITMLPIKKIFKEYLVEVRFRFIMSPFHQDSLNKAIKEFHKTCEDYKKTLNVKKLIKETNEKNRSTK